MTVPNSRQQRKVFQTGIGETKLQTYKTLVSPLLECASDVWDSFTNKLKEKLERVQSLALRFIFSKYRRLDSPSVLYPKGNPTLLVTQRKDKGLKLLYLILGDSLSIDKNTFLNIW